MNITLAKNKKKPQLTVTAVAKKNNSSFFDNSDDDDDDNSDDNGHGGGSNSHHERGEGSGRSVSSEAQLRIARVNKDLAEKAKRAEEEARKYRDTLDPSIYDFDGYSNSKSDNDSNNKSLLGQATTATGCYSAPPQVDAQRAAATTAAANVPQDAPRSRYVDDLMQAAKRREKEADRANERRLLREKEKEERENPNVPEQSFITSAYKEKLKERELWEAEEKRQQEQDKQEDVRKVGLVAFYANQSKNISLGADVQTSSTSAYTSGGTRIQNLIAPTPPTPLSSSSLLSSSTSSSLPSTTTSENLAVNNSVSRKRDHENGFLYDQTKVSSSNEGGENTIINGSTQSQSYTINSNCTSIITSNSNTSNSNVSGLTTSSSSSSSSSSAPAIDRDEKILSAKERYLARKLQKVEEITSSSSS